MTQTRDNPRNLVRYDSARGKQHAKSTVADLDESAKLAEFPDLLSSNDLIISLPIIRCDNYLHQPPVKMIEGRLLDSSDLHSPAPFQQPSHLPLFNLRFNSSLWPISMFQTPSLYLRIVHTKPSNFGVISSKLPELIFRLLRTTKLLLQCLQ